MSNVFAFKLPNEVVPSLVKRGSQETLDDVTDIAKLMANISARLHFMEKSILDLPPSQERDSNMSALQNLRLTVRESLVRLGAHI